MIESRNPITIEKLIEENEKLKQEVDELSAQLSSAIRDAEHHKIRTALLDKSKLPKAKSPACYNCKYVAFVRLANGGLYFLGCAKDLAKGGCHSYDHTDINKPPLQEMKKYLDSMEEDYWLSQALCQDSQISSSQPPLCHEL